MKLAHLALLLAVSVAAATAAAVGVTYVVADREFRAVLDDDLELQSEFLAELLAADRGRLDAESLRKLLRDTFESDDEDTRWVSIYDRATGLAVSNLAYDIVLADDRKGSVRLAYDGYEWQGYRSREDGIVVQILRREDLYRELRNDILEDIVTPALVGGGVNLLLLGLLSILFIWPLTRLARQLEKRPAGSLAPLRLWAPAQEIRLLRDALNRTMSGIDTVLTRERQFAGDVAHELRTPLTTLKLELGAPHPDLPTVRAEVDRLTRLVEQLLVLARLEQGEWQQRFEPVDLAALAGEVLERYRPRFATARMTLAGELLPAKIAGDATLLEILLENLLNNVLRHCPPETEACVRLSAGPGTVLLVVEDSGPGISPELRETMEGGFRSLDSRGEGLGLGLAICSRIAAVHAAELSFRSRGDGGEGLVVEARFPAA